MKFHVTFHVRESIALSEIKRVQTRIANAIQNIMKSGKIQASGVMPDRKMFFLVEADVAEDLWRLFAPLFDVAKADIQLVTSFEMLPKLFEELQELQY